MTQNQGAGRVPSTDEKVNSSHTMASEQDKLLNIDFENVEDILDFSAPCVPISAIIKNPRYLPEPCKLTAEEPVKLLQIQLTISSNEPKQKRFQCIICGKTFAQSVYLHRHMRIHTGVKPYSCPVCWKPFSRNDYMMAHFYSHRKDKVHRCWVCSEAFYDLERFSNHCRSHEDNENNKTVMDKPITDSGSSASKLDSLKEQLTIEDRVPAATFARQLELISSLMMDEECIACVENPLYLSHHQAISINSNVATSHSDADSLMVSINVIHFLPSS